MWLADLIGGGVVLLFGLGVIVFSLQLPYSSEFGPGPGFLPLWLGIGMAGCAVAVILKVLKKHDRTEAFIKPQTRVGLQMLGLIVGGFLLLPVLGFSVGLALFTATAMRLIGKHGMRACALTAVGAAIGIHYIFGEWLSIPLPTGVVGW
jgi:putative tricarboxylic transport membrane protein